MLILKLRESAISTSYMCFIIVQICVEENSKIALYNPKLIGEITPRHQAVLKYERDQYFDLRGPFFVSESLCVFLTHRITNFIHQQWEFLPCRHTYSKAELFSKQKRACVGLESFSLIIRISSFHKNRHSA